MKKIKLFYLLTAATLLSACSSVSVEEPTRPTTPGDEGTVYEISLNFGGDFVEVTEDPLTRAQDTPKTYYGINIYCMKADGSEGSYSHYAYGVFDNKDDMTISLLGGYKYKFQCTSVKETDLYEMYLGDLTHSSYTYLSYPFRESVSSSTLNGSDFVYKISKLNKFTTSQTVYLTDLTKGTSKYKRTDSAYGYTYEYAPIDRYYGELEGFIPSANGVASIALKRTVFGINLVINGVPDGSLTWGIKGSYTLPLYLSSATGSDVTEFNCIYTFSEVKDCWSSTDVYNENFTINFTWTRSNGFKQTFSETFTGKRNTQTTITVNLKGGANDVTLGIVDDDTPMANDNVNIDYDGGDMNDTPVDPTE